MNYYYLQIAQLVISLLLIIAILLQNRGAGLGGVFGGEGNVYRTKRGVEKGLFYATIILAILFFILAVWSLLKT
ncbi:MAG: preprotein translocase subunit SecG [Patescibacteria group bacterium]